MEPESPSPQRIRQVTAAAATWRGQLIDLSWRNQLLYYKNLRYGTLDFADADPAAVATLLAGDEVRLSRLFSRTLFPDRRVRVRAIANKATEAAEERGIGICHVALGMATWRNASGAATLAAPVLLREATITPTGVAEDDFELTVSGEPVLNPALVHVLAEQFKVTLDPDELTARLDPADLEPSVVFDAVRDASEHVAGFRIDERRILGTFSYAKLPMVEDLATNLDALIAHDVIAAIAGNQEAAAAIAMSGDDVNASAPDDLPPEDEFLVLDADSSQQHVVNAVVAGQSLVVSGPPGTGKSQTIANMIASLVATGQTVLFVAEKRAAIAAVLDRLDAVGLGDLTFDVQDGGGSRAAQIDAVTAGLSAQPVADDRTRTQLLTRRRAQLRTHDTAMNARREPWQVSVFEAQSALIQLRGRWGDAVATPVRFGGTDLAVLDADTMRQVREQLSEFATLGGLALTVTTSPWSGADVADAERGEAALALVARIKSKTLPEAWRAIDDLSASTGLTGPATVADWSTLLAALADVAGVVAAMGHAPFDAPLPDLIAATAPRRSLAARGARQRRHNRARAAGLWPGAAALRRKDLNSALHQAHSALQRWRDAQPTTDVPPIPANLDGVTARVERLVTELRELGGVIRWADFGALPRPQLTGFVDALAADERTVRKLPRLTELTIELRRRGLDPLLADLRARGADPELAAATFETCWYESILDRVAATDPAIAHFDGRRHTANAAEFRELDAAHVAAAAARVRDRVAARLADVGLAHPEQSRLVAAQAARTSGQLPLRRLFSAAPDFLTALKPCWAMSPLLVSQLLPGDRPYFDVVVFDEASQIVPADAIAAIARGRRVVVAGDRFQLPPTQFFAVGTDDGGESAVNDDGSINLALTTGFESILDVAAAALTGARSRGLAWHYRSRDERLIAFSNSWIYGDRMVTFPGIAGRECLSLEVVRRARSADGDADGVAAEVDRVVARILDHAAHRPELSLGVITMGINHMERIDRRLRERLRTRPRLRAYFEDPPGEPFFVKNLERVQGDERDAIILSIGYGKRADGSLSHNFGPLNQDGGHRRLNVAITRARKQMTVVSSFSHRDMDPERSTAAGVAMLREYLAYAAAHGDSSSDQVTPTDLSAFDSAVRDRLVAAGIPVVAQYGVTGHRIDFAVADPHTPGAMVLAIEADGPHYHSAPTVRDRDRLRQDQLARLGWSYHRIWAADWFTDPDGCVARAQAAFHRALVADPELPPTTPGRPIADYTDGELVAVLQWIDRDGTARSDAELLREFVSALGFAKAGARIRARFDRASRFARLH